MATTPNNRISQLRADVLKAHRAAGKKISRLRTVQGAEVANTKYDPRRDPKKYKGYTAKQLESQLKRLTGFTSRDVQFVGGVHGTPIPKKVWDNYANEQNKVNKARAEAKSKVDPIKLPSGETIAQRFAKTVADHPRAGNPAVNPMVPITRTPKNFTSDWAVKKLTKELKKMTRPHYTREQQKAHRDTTSKMLDLIREPKLAEGVRSLTPRQFDIMWQWSSFFNAMSEQYEISQALLDDRQKPYDEGVANTALREALRHVEWAKTL